MFRCLRMQPCAGRRRFECLDQRPAPGSRNIDGVPGVMLAESRRGIYFEYDFERFAFGELRLDQRCLALDAAKPGHEQQHYAVRVRVGFHRRPGRRGLGAQLLHLSDQIRLDVNERFSLCVARARRIEPVRCRNTQLLENIRCDDCRSQRATTAVRRTPARRVSG